MTPIPPDPWSHYRTHSGPKVIQSWLDEDFINGSDPETSKVDVWGRNISSDVTMKARLIGTSFFPSSYRQGSTDLG
ncbi:hypothetical protein TNCV_4038441 [Trichonephila clavipes]|nr:hypothetical protein TNCV_4038441 [Trichonephila clavipes]